MEKVKIMVPNPILLMDDLEGNNISKKHYQDLIQPTVFLVDLSGLVSSP